jgi:NTE family protein
VALPDVALADARVTDPHLALVLTGGGARAAYQVGFLRHLASRYPNLSPGILTGVSAGGIIATHLASRSGDFAESVDRLFDLWRSLRMEHVFHVNPKELTTRMARWGLRLMSGGAPGAPHARSLVDTTPLHDYLCRTLHTEPDGTISGIARSLEAGRLVALTLTATSYSTGQSVTWVQAVDGCGVRTWERPQRKGIETRVRVDHVLASSALPLLFPAVEVDGAWYGDGGIRLTAPLSPAVHLGAHRIVAVSTRYERSRAEANRPAVSGYPPPAQVAGMLLNAVFLDLLDTDALRLEQINTLLDRLPADARDGMRHIDMLVLRPSVDLGRLANEFEADLPRTFRFLVRGLGSRETRSNDLLSLLMFQPDYIARLIELGEADARVRAADIERFLGLGGVPPAPGSPEARRPPARTSTRIRNR